MSDEHTQEDPQVGSTEWKFDPRPTDAGEAKCKQLSELCLKGIRLVLDAAGRQDLLPVMTDLVAITVATGYAIGQEDAIGKVQWALERLADMAVANAFLRMASANGRSADYHRVFRKICGMSEN